MKKGTNLSDAEIAKIKSKIVEEWRKLKGLDKNGARLQYMELIQAWDGYGSNLFEVEQTSNKHWPKELWLAISLNGVGIYVRGEYVFVGVVVNVVNVVVVYVVVVNVVVSVC